MRSTALVVGAAALLAVAGCTMPEERLRDLRAEQDDNLNQIAGIARQPLDAFLAEPYGSCDSRNLWFAQYILDAGGPSDLFEVNSLDASLRLDVADAAAAQGCPEVTRDIYREVIARYVGWGYAAQRQRAEIGLAELRADD